MLQGVCDRRGGEVRREEKRCAVVGKPQFESWLLHRLPSLTVSFHTIYTLYAYSAVLVTDIHHYNWSLP